MIKNLYLVLIGIVTVASSCRTTYPAEIESRQYVIDGKDEPAPSDSIQAIIAPYKSELDATMNERVGRTSAMLNKSQPEGTLNNWVADAIYAMANPLQRESLDFAVQNYGGIRLTELPKGPVTVRTFYELMPFDNRITVVEMDLPTLRQFIAHMAARGGWPVSAQLRYGILDGKPFKIKLHGKPLREDRIYRVAMPDYVANGGDETDFLEQSKKSDLDLLVRDALIDFARAENAAGRPLSAEIDGRVVTVNQ